MSVTYPSIFKKPLREQINYYFAENKHSNKRIALMKRLIEDTDMQVTVFPTLLKINNAEIPKTTSYIRDSRFTSYEPIFIYLCFCIELLESFNHVNPITKVEHDALFGNVIKNVMALEKNIKEIQNAGISHTRCFVATSLDWQMFSGHLENMKNDAKEALNFEPVYGYRSITHDNEGMSRKTINYKDHDFIWRLSDYTKSMFKQRLHDVVAATANILLCVECFTEDSVKETVYKLNRRR